MTPSTETWTTRKLLDWMTTAFSEKHVTDPRRSAEVLLEHVINMERIRLYAHSDRPASPDELASLRELVKRALQLEPVQYLVGEWWFFGIPLYVDSRVLIPRPSTETLVEEVLETLKRQERADAPLLIADVGTGSGCVTCALLKQLPNARAIAIDISQDALAVASKNFQRHNLQDRVSLVEGDMCLPLKGHAWLDDPSMLDVLVSNPPYIPDHEWETPGLVGDDVKAWEPTNALRGGPDGLDLVKPLLRDGVPLLRDQGIFAVEVAASTAQAVARLAIETTTLNSIRVIQDLEKHDRVVFGLR